MKPGRWVAVGLGLLVACGPATMPITPQATLSPTPTGQLEVRPSPTLPATWTPTPAASPQLVSVVTVTTPAFTSTPTLAASLWPPDEIPAVTLTPTRAAAVSSVALQHLTQAQESYADDELEEALDRIDQALELEPGNSPMWVFRGQLNAELGRPLSAEQDLKQALALDPFQAPARLALSQLYVDYARWTPAGDELNRYLQLAPDDLDARLELGAVYESLGDWADAIEVYSDTLALDPASAPALLSRGALRLQAGQLDAAWSDLSAALEISPTEKAYLQRAEISQTWGASLQVAADLRESLAFVEDARLRYSRLLSAGEAYLDGNAGADALLMYTEAFSLTHGVDAMLGVGESYLSIGDYNSAAAVFSDTLATAGPWDLGPALSGRGQAYAGLGEWQAALSDLDGALAADMPDEKRAEVYGRRGAVQAELDEWEQAVADWTQAYRLSMDPQYLYRRGMAYLVLEERVLAKEDLTNYVAAAGETGGNPEWLQTAETWLATQSAEEP